MTGDRLIELGFSYIGTCNCGGGISRKYKLSEWVVYLSRKNFKVKKGGITVKNFTPIEQAEEYIFKAIPQLLIGKQIPGSASV